MVINFDYSRKRIDSTDGYILKGALYRCNYTRYKTLYRNPASGTECVELYNFEPKADFRASVIILPGLGSINMPFLLWMGTHLASAGVHSTIVVLPGNYTRVDHNSVSGRSYLWPDIKIMFQFWEHAVVDVISAIDLLEQKGKWKDNNCLLGYCLGGMIGTIVTALDKRVAETILMTTGGHMPKIFHESKATNFARKILEKNTLDPYRLKDRAKLYKIYDDQLPVVRKMSLFELKNNNDIHPLLKLDPLSYGHFLNKSKITLIEAMIDETLPLTSITSLYKELRGASRYILPMTHVSWLPFERFLAQYILLKLNINDRKLIKQALKKQKIVTDLIKNLFN